MSFRSRDQEDGWHDAYHDDPFEEKSNRKFKKNLLTSLAVIAGSLLFYQNTLAANISLNLGNGNEFGQGLTQAVACSGNSKLLITPTSTFTNSSGSGSYSLSNIKVSNIPDSCFGSDFVINVYGDTSTAALALFNTSSTDAIIYNNSGTFEAGVGSTGMTVSSGSGSFTATFTSPVAVSNNIYKVTIQSTPHAVASCAQGGTCSVGDTGPGGGTVFYVSAAAFTETGAPCASTCRYLEAAPNTWYGGSSDPGLPWSADTTTGTSINSQAIGSGYSNTTALIALNSTPGYAMTAARAYRGPNNLNDWFLGSYLEMDKLAIYANARGNIGFRDWYWVSSDQSPTYPGYGWVRMFYNGAGYQGGWKLKSISYYVRPIRAF